VIAPFSTVIPAVRWVENWSKIASNVKGSTYIDPSDDYTMISGEIGTDPPWMDSNRAYFARVAPVKLIGEQNVALE